MSELHENTDALNDALFEAESALVALNLGVNAQVALDESLTLAFRKKKLVVFATCPTRIDGHTSDLLECSREVRVKAAHKLRPLYEALIAAVAEHDQCVRDAIRAAEEFTARIRKGDPT